MRFHLLAAILAVFCAAPALGQDTPANGLPDPAQERPPSRDYLAIGIGAGFSPSYSGSDDYALSVLPIVQGSLGGVGISPRAGGLTLDFIPDPDTGIGFDAGIAIRLRSDRASQIKDDIVQQYTKLDRAVEIGPSLGLNLPQVFSRRDRVSLGVDAMFDVAGAHSGTVITPSLGYFTPLGRTVAASFSLGTQWADSDFHDYYFRSDPADFLGDGPAPLAPFAPDGSGFTQVSANVLLAIEPDGDRRSNGLSFVVIGGYSRLLGDAADTPFTSERGSRNQLVGGVGVGYTF